MKNISFVVQGPIIAHSQRDEGVYSTQQVLESIRKYFPEGEIILSTWKGSNISGLIYNKVIFSEDPGSIIVKHIPNPYNHNRLIVSSRNGIAAASHDVVVKTRTDICFQNNSIASLLPFITPTKGKFALFSHCILSTNYYVRNPMRLNLLFHASDIILMGKKSDLELFFAPPIVKQENMIGINKEIKMVAEQYLTLKSIEKVKRKTYDFLNGRTHVSQFMDSERYLFNNFNFFSIEAFGVEFPKRLLHAFFPEGNYTLEETQALSLAYRQGRLSIIYACKRAIAYLRLRTAMYLKAKKYITSLKFKTFRHADH